MILVDASGLYTALSDTQPHHAAARRVLETDSGPRALSPYVLAEVDYLLVKYAGVDAELALLDDVAAGAYELALFQPADVRSAREVAARYREHRIGLADASIVVLAERYASDRVLTLNERHFRVLRTPSGHPFTVLPADS